MVNEVPLKIDTIRGRPSPTTIGLISRGGGIARWVRRFALSVVRGARGASGVAGAHCVIDFSWL